MRYPKTSYSRLRNGMICHPFARRRMVSAIAFALLTAVSQAPVQAETIRFRIDFENLKSQKIERVPVKVHIPTARPKNLPLVIYMSGCNGTPTDGARTIIDELVRRSVAVAELESLSMWGRFYDACTTNDGLTGAQRAEEAYRTRDELVKRGIAKIDNVGLFGNSHGGWAITYAMFLDPTPKYDTTSSTPFAAAVAWYPYCQTNDSPTFANRTATLLLGGGRDTWTHWSRCRHLERQTMRATGSHAPLELVLYEEATHSWDSQRPPRTFASNQGDTYLEHNSAVTADSVSRTLSWFEQHLKF